MASGTPSGGSPGTPMGQLAAFVFVAVGWIVLVTFFQIAVPLSWLGAPILGYLAVRQSTHPLVKLATVVGGVGTVLWIAYLLGRGL